MKKKFMIMAASVLTLAACETPEMLIAYSTVNVPEEGGTNFVKITEETGEQLITPNIQKINGRLSWWANPYFAISRNGESVAYISSRNDNSNIFVRSLTQRGGSQQRTFQGGVQDVAFSPDGQTLCFTKASYTSNGYPTNSVYYRKVISANSIFTTSATQGSIVRQISTPGTKDYGVHYSADGKKIFFSRSDGSSFSIWSYEDEKGTLTNLCMGLCPTPTKEGELLCIRQNSMNNYEVWLVDYTKGMESVILSQDGHSFTTPSLSPDGRWILYCSNSDATETKPENLDIFVVRADGSQMTQLTYHPGNDLSPAWAPDGKSIYFLSQRGTENGEYNIWKMNFDM